MANTAPRSPLTVWIAPADAELLDEVLGCLHRASRHVVTIAAVRAGLHLLRDHPELVPALIADRRAAQHVRLRQSEP